MNEFVKWYMGTSDFKALRKALTIAHAISDDLSEKEIETADRETIKKTFASVCSENREYRDRFYNMVIKKKAGADILGRLINRCIDEFAEELMKQDYVDNSYKLSEDDCITTMVALLAMMKGEI